MARASTRWFREYINPHLIQSVAVRSVVFSGKTTFQKVKVLDTASLGRCLILDGKIQSAEADEFIYHESLVHPVMVSHPSPQTVFIAGGGEGATLREVLAHNTVRRAVMVDIDREVVEICRRLLPHHHRGAFEDPRLELRFSDARDFLEHDHGTYDVIIIDLPDPLEGGPASSLYTQGFYHTALNRLNPGGLVSVQSEACMAGNLQAFTAITNTLKSVFPQVFPYHAMVPSFSSNWGFNIASLGPSPLALSEEDVERHLLQRGCSSLQFYDGKAHRGLFSLPRYVREAVRKETRVITEESPISVF